MRRYQQTKPERDYKIFKLREDGKSWGEIAKEFGVSRTRIQQICRSVKVKLEELKSQKI